MASEPRAEPGATPPETAWSDADRSGSVTLIGMPGAGKSSVGVLLAKRMVARFVDSDLLIQERADQPLQNILAVEGVQALRDLEEAVLLDLEPARAVIATGGSAVYSAPAMQHLRQHSTVVYLYIDLETVKARIGDFSQRGIAKHPGQSIADIFAEREPLYRSWADVTVRADQAIEAEVSEILAHLKR